MMSKCKARGCDDRGNPWCDAPYCSDMCNITDLEDENKDLQAQLKASQDEAKNAISILNLWYNLGWSEDYREAIEKLTNKQASETKGEE